MKALFTILAILLSGASPSVPSSPSVPFGILGHEGSASAIFATSRVEPGKRLNAYQLGEWNKAEVTVTSASHVESGPLYDGSGNNVAWKHGFSSRTQFSPSTLWICLPSDVTLVGKGAETAVLQRRGDKIGEVHVSTKEEGLEVTVKTSKSSEKVYYYLNYDVQ